MNPYYMYAAGFVLLVALCFITGIFINHKIQTPMPHMPFMEEFPSGKKTYFREKILTGRDYTDWIPYTEEDWAHIWKLQVPAKLHTFRETEFWKRYIGKEVEPFYWAEKPYRSGHIVFAKVKLVSWQRVEIKYNDGRVTVEVDGDIMGPVLLKEMAINDGFESAEEFFQYFVSDWSGYIYHFTNLKY